MTPSSESFTPINQIGEFGLIDRLRDVLAAASDTPEALIQGIGDDAAVYRVGDGRVHVVTTDALVEGVHFDRTFTPMRYLGWKAVATNVSDVVAMNAQPRYATVALALPNSVSVEQAEALYGGMAEACQRYGLSVVGGDVTAAARLTLSVTVIGEAEESAVVYRRGAQVGDLLCVTGDLGSAAAGLKVLLAGKQGFEAGGDGESEAAAQPNLTDFAYAVERQLYPQARLDRIRHWAEVGVRPRALIDISDGLASEVHHLANASGHGAVIEAGLLPIHVQTFKAAERFEEAPLSLALYGGEDYELLFAIPESEKDKMDANTFAVVGQVVEADAGVTLRMPEGEVIPLEARGFDHFG
ncbi:MAG: thiamine-phosphate kinase [Rhodothermaceae bacterium]|nr:thiamine-phosphate kinase [Rhodothermaceae bacterium]